MDKSSKQYTTFTVGNLGFFKCDHMPFGLCNAPAMFQQLMQNCLGELNLICSLIYLDDIVIFWQMAEEHLHCLHVIFDWFREHNLKLKPLKCSFFREEITYLAHSVSKDGVWPSNLNLKAIAECACCLKLTQRCMPFLVWWATTGGSSKGLHTLHSHSVNIWLEKGPAGSQSRCHFQKMPWRLLKHWSRHVWQPPFWLLLTTLNCSCWRLMCPRMDWGAVLSQKQADGWYHPIAYGSRALTPHEKNYHSTKLEFLALKWAVTEHFKEYLPYQSFLVRMDNNPLMYT